MNINHNLTKSDLEIIYIKSPLEHQIQQQEVKDSGWIFDKINSMTVFFYKTGEMNELSFVKSHFRISAILNIENIDKYCFSWSILDYSQPCNNNHPNRVSNYRQNFFELNIEGFDLTKGFKCSDVHEFEKLNNLSINIFELNSFQYHYKWRHKLIPIEVSNNESDRVIDLLIYKNQYSLIEELNVFLGDHHKTFICGRCLTSYTSENMLMSHKPKCENNNKTTIRTSTESHLHWKKNIFIKIHSFFGFMQILKLIMRKMILV